MSTNTAPTVLLLIQKRLCFGSNAHLTPELSWLTEAAELEKKIKIKKKYLWIHQGADVDNRKSYTSLKYNCTHHSPISPSCFPFLSLFSPEAVAHTAEPVEKSTCVAASARRRTRISASAADNGGVS